MKIDTTKAQMRRGLLELCVLSIIARKEAYPSDILEELKSAELIVVEGTLYPLLSRLKNAGLLSYNWQESSSGPPRKYYNLTEEGEEFFENLKSAWNNLKQSVEKTVPTHETDS
jgi:PadR family transcriptional regulator PadR